ncbi:MAG: exodeoxyribonuclease VII large subunit [Geminicoccaceae bacterium]|nr:exodeoxyribonuclease VII large subunit [Geminicoccaceae bacterium]
MATVSNLREVSVGELAFSLKRTIETAFGLVRVRGELSGLKRAASGHVYFALKDDAAVLDAVAWRGTAARFAFRPEDGLEVVCTGKLTTYPGRSRYQIVVERMEPAGAGALMALFEERKRRLEAEGLFDPARKRPLPYLPETIGIVTSPTGAVIRDILHRLAERFPRRVVVWPVLVQGEGAAEQVAAAIRGFDALPRGGPIPRPDLLIVARGGGAVEDLWAFNEEAVARAAASCRIPLISAVGHETDTTLIDFVADRRAPTPTAAAEIAVPVRRDLLLQTGGLGERLLHGVGRLLKDQRRHVDALGRGLTDPRHAVTLAAQRLDDQSERLERASSLRLERLGGRLGQAALGLRPPRQTLAEARLRLEARAGALADLARDRLARAEFRLGRTADLERLHGMTEARLAAARAAFDARAGLLESLGPGQVLARGYAIVRSADTGDLLPSAEAALAEAAYEIRFHDGVVRARRDGKAEPGQGRLFDA